MLVSMKMIYCAHLTWEDLTHDFAIASNEETFKVELKKAFISFLKSSMMRSVENFANCEEFYIITDFAQTCANLAEEADTDVYAALRSACSENIITYTLQMLLVDDDATNVSFVADEYRFVSNERYYKASHLLKIN
jgi:hypothetical protein